ncbi:Arabinanase/levansucrase/invertase [Massarina eburnea CBS 473.64]|uniref:Arabinanase/levansucrase/invertase n=1 Tax=Massarina eburnea CBS 473.64 TaxID=1395130 RepID=A0A6A6SBS7_9PLEO|nr:Arabinanase/levansucrase/invertase [Massarina eburnea CBS 473.64]
MTRGDSSASATTEEDSDFEETSIDVDVDIEANVPIQKPPDNKSSLHKFCLPDRWIAVVGLLATFAVILGAVLGASLPKKTTVGTGIYPENAPFREVIHENFPDPALLRYKGLWYVYASNSAAGIIQSKLHGEEKDLGVGNVQLATSKNFVDWEVRKQSEGPLQELGVWVNREMMAAGADASVSVRRADVWAPDIIQRPDGRFVLYYSATAAGEKTIHCIGASVSESPLGPFEPLSSSIVCPIKEGGAIDTGPFKDEDGNLYLTYKLDGNARGNGGECLNTVPPLKDTPIFLQKMEMDGYTTSGPPVKILDRTDSDGPLVEAPSLIRTHEGIYVLFFSTGCTFDPSYNLKYATSTNITGPYTRAAHPLLDTGAYGLLAPGSASVARDNTTWRMAFHARKFTDKAGIRPMYVSNLRINGTNVTMEAPA